MQNDFTAESRPANAAPTGRLRQRRMVRGMLALPLAVALLTAGATTALAVETTTTNGYGTTNTAPPPTTPTTPTTPATTPTTPAATTPATKTESGTPAEGGVSPTKTSSTAKETGSNEPAKSGVEPTSTTQPTATAASKTLPFTGINLTWVVFGGVLLLGMGTSLLLTQRGRRHPGR